MNVLPDTLMIPVLLILGAAFGSFLNVVIYRVPKKMSVILYNGYWIPPGSVTAPCRYEGASK